MVETSKSKIFIRKRLILLAIMIAVAAQFYRPDKSIQQAVSFSDFLTEENAPQNVSALIKNSCYNCHSNSIEYYWYDHIAPASWYVDYHIKEGKRHLNFSNWATLDTKSKRDLLSKMATNINDGTMPLASYTFIHRNAELSKDEKQEILTWLFSIEAD